MADMKYTPDNITGPEDLGEDGIFVFGSNIQGRHGGGAAKLAREKFGAVRGRPEGLMGNCYALPTKDLDANEILDDHSLVTNIMVFLNSTTFHQNLGLTYYVTKIGCGLAGGDEQHMISLVRQAIKLCQPNYKGNNVIWPKGWIEEEESDVIHICGTGPRRWQLISAEAKVAFVAKIKEALQGVGTNLYGYSGMAEGFDSALAVAFHELDIPWTAAVPNRGYGNYYWGGHSLTGTNRMAAYEKLLSWADKVVYVDEEIGHKGKLRVNGRHMNFFRNDWMLDHATHVITPGYIYNGKASGGTKQCIQSAKSRGLTIVEVSA